MKYIKLLLLALLIPQITFGAVAVGWNATSTASNLLYPNLVNGVLKVPSANEFRANFFTGGFFNATSSTATSTFAGTVGVGTTSPSYGKSGDLVLGLNKNLILTTNRTTDNFIGNIIFKNEGASTTKSGLEWYGFNNSSVARAWLVFHESLNGELDGSHGAPHLEIETSDLSGAKQGRWTVQSDCDYDCKQTFNQSEVYITRNSGQTNGNLLFNGGGQLRNTGVMQIIPNNAVNTLGFRIATSTDNDIMIDVTSGTELEVQDNLNLTGNQYISGLLGIGTTSPANQLTIEKSGASGTVAGATIELRQNQTAINTTQNSNLGEILFSGADIFPNETGIGAKIRGEATGIWNATTNDYPSSLLFFTNPNASEALREVMRITDTSFVGIGTTSPYAKLSVVGEVVGANFTGTTTASSTFAGGVRANIFNATSATASSTFANGINLTAGCFARNGVCLGLSNLSGNVNLATQVTGVLPIANGGTASSTSLGGILAGNGTSAIKSAIIGSGLTFDGSTLSATGGSSASSTLLSDMNTFSTTGTTTFVGSINANRLTSATARITGLTNCNSSLTLKTDLYGNIICDTDQTGAGGSVTGHGIAGMMASWSSASNLIATSTIIGERFYATSTTATSTILGSLAIGGSTPDATFSVKGIGGKVAQFFTSASTKIIDIANDGIVTLLGAWNFGDATSLEIPNSASPTYGAGGILALDTTSNNLTLATSTTGHYVVASATTTLHAFSVSSTTPVFVSGQTMTIPSKGLPQVVTAIWCKVDGGTSKVINLTDGTNDTNSITCTTTGAQYPITTNSNWTANESMGLEMGATSGTVNWLNVDIRGYRTSD